QQTGGELGGGVARVPERSDRARRRRQAAAGFFQHHRQRHRRNGIDERRAPARVRDTEQRHGNGGGQDSRQRLRNCRRQDRQNFQSVLYLKGQRHRAWAGRREKSDRRASWNDRGAKQSGQWNRIRAGDSTQRRGARQRRFIVRIVYRP